MSYLIMAIGSTLRGDDGVGAAVVAALQAHPLPPDVTLLDAGTPGFELLLLMQDYAHVIVVDATDMGAAPGVWRQFSPDEVRLQSGDLYLRGTLHYAGLAEALSLGMALGTLPPHITIFGVQPQAVDWREGLSVPVAAAVPAVAAAVLAHLETTHA